MGRFDFCKIKPRSRTSKYARLALAASACLENQKQKRNESLYLASSFASERSNWVIVRFPIWQTIIKINRYPEPEQSVGLISVHFVFANLL